MFLFDERQFHGRRLFAEPYSMNFLQRANYQQQLTTYTCDKCQIKDQVIDHENKLIKEGINNLFKERPQVAILKMQEKQKEKDALKKERPGRGLRKEEMRQEGHRRTGF